MDITRNLPVVDSILNAYCDVIGKDFVAYRNHVYRVVNLCYAARSLTPEEQEKVQVAGAFHDIGIWKDGTLDYLPSRRCSGFSCSKDIRCKPGGDRIAISHPIRNQMPSV